MGRNRDFQEPELYYIVFMYKYYQLNLFLVLIWKFNQKLHFQHRLPKLGLIRAKYVQNGEKIWFLSARSGIT